MNSHLLNRGPGRATILLLISFFFFTHKVKLVLGQSIVRLDTTQVGFFNFQHPHIWPTQSGEIWSGGKGFAPTVLKNNHVATPYFDGIPTLLPKGNPLCGVWIDSAGTTWMAARWLPSTNIPYYGQANGGILKVINPTATSGFTIFNSLQNVPMIEISEPEWLLALPEQNGGKVWLSSFLGLRRLTLNTLSSILYPQSNLPVSGPFEGGKTINVNVFFRNKNFQWLQITPGPIFKSLSVNSWFGLPEKSKLSDISISQESDTLVAIDTSGLGQTFRLMRRKSGLNQILTDDTVSLIACQADGKIWYSGLRKGLFVLENGQKKSISSLSKERVIELKIDSSHVKWILTDSGKVYQINDIFPLILQPDSIILLCDSNTWKFTDGSSTTGQGISTRLWDFGDGQTSTEPNTKHRYEREGKYKVILTLKDNNGSEQRVEKEIWVTENLYLKINTTTPIRTCQPVRLEAYGTGHFHWTLPDGNTDTSFAVLASQSGWYVATASNSYCEVKDSVEVRMESQPSQVELEIRTASGQLLSSHSGVFLPIKLSGNPVQMEQVCRAEWKLDGHRIESDTVFPVPFFVSSEGTHVLEMNGLTYQGCPVEGRKEFTLSNPSIPNLITANGDGKNDQFEIMGTTIDQLTLFNRWGKEVFNASPYQNDWPPSDLEPGIYFYKLTAANQVFSGWVDVVK